MLFAYSLSPAQSSSDTNKVKFMDTNRVQVQEQVQGDTTLQDGEKVKERLQDQKMAGSRFGQPFGKMKRGKDVFIDKDGDGICDQRVNGMGFEQHRKRLKGGKQGSSGGHGGGSGSGGGNRPGGK